MRNLNLIIESIKNYFSKKKLFFISENANWVTDWISFYITKNLNESILASKKTLTYHLLRNKIIHLGSINTIIRGDQLKKIHPSNKVVVSWFHVCENDPKIKLIPELNNNIDFIHTSCEKTKKELISHGLKKEKIIVIPLGVDLNVFNALKKEKRDKIKKELKIPKNKIIIGSFQKDGNGWGDGLSPKLIKGPDIFCSVVENLSKKYQIHILLTGPARGYVKKKLDLANISYTHKYLEEYSNIVNFFNVLDFYLITSRIEGGPAAILESWATGTPIISTEVGMSLDIITNKKNGFITKIEDVDDLTNKSIKIIEDNKLRMEFINNGLNKVKEYDYQKISKQYYKKIYKKLI